MDFETIKQRLDKLLDSDRMGELRGALMILGNAVSRRW